MLWLNWRLFLTSVALLPLGVLALRHYQARLTTQTRVLRERSSELGSFIIESLLGVRLIVASGSERREAEKFRGLNANFVESVLSMQVLSFLASAAPSTVLTLSTAIVFLYGGKLVIDGQLTVGGLVAFMAYHMRLLSPVQNLLGVYTGLLTGAVALGRVFEVLTCPSKCRMPPVRAPWLPSRARSSSSRFIFVTTKAFPSLTKFRFTFQPARSASSWARAGRVNRR